jgi:cell division septation protein DedD
VTPTAANTAEESTNWRLSWYPEGRCDSFAKDAILAYAPPTSGVYGLFNFDCQVFIGESENIQEALLRHKSETEFHSRHLQPTGFTFEACAEEVRKSKAAELIAKYRPVMQTEAALTETYLLSDDLVVNEPGVDGDNLLAADDQQFPDHERDERPKPRRSLPLKPILTVMIVSGLIAGALVIFYSGGPADYRIRTQVKGANLISARTETGLRSQNATLIDASRSANKPNTGTTPATAETRGPVSSPDGAALVAAKNTQAVEPAATQGKANPIAHGVENAKSSKNWSVQISAAPAKDIADTLMQRLKADGYDGYVVAAEVNGKTYFRVRVGPFDGREEAESARQSLAQREGYRDAYLTGD